MEESTGWQGDSLGRSKSSFEAVTWELELVTCSSAWGENLSHEIGYLEGNVLA
jgi:hypothetical protein